MGLTDVLRKLGLVRTPPPVQFEIVEGPKVTFADMGPHVGECSLCNRKVFAVPGATTMRIVQGSDPADMIEHSARWCPQCRKLYCLGCAVSQSNQLNQQCPECHVRMVDHYNLPT
jgi:hypothetical protein